MKVVSWNVAGLRACIKKGFEDFFNEVDADIFCLQEVKALEEEITFKNDKYLLYINPAEKKGYSGTAIYTKIKPLSVSFGIGIDEHDHEGRIITLEFDNFYLVNTYVPNVKRDLSRMEYRKIWEKDYLDYIKKLEKTKSVIMCGDFNVAHTEMDIKNSKQNIGNAGFTYEKRSMFTNLLNHNLIDTFRYSFLATKDAYTWWSYMRGVRERNIGWRIDYFIMSKNFIETLEEAIIYKDIYGSDHCPIGIKINI